jgi:ArsR family transcriptional regulator
MSANAKALTRYKAQAQVLKALAHPSRLLMVEELSKGERCVCELAAMVGAQMATVSRHLSQLKNAGIVEDDKRGVQVFYRLRTPCVMKFFACVCDVHREAARRHLEFTA